MKQKQKEGM